MGFKLQTPRDIGEFRLTKDFLDWQLASYKVVIDIKTLELTKGCMKPILLDSDDNILAKGFVEIVQFYTNNGYLLC